MRKFILGILIFGIVQIVSADVFLYNTTVKVPVNSYGIVEFDVNNLATNETQIVLLQDIPDHVYVGLSQNFFTTNKLGNKIFIFSDKVGNYSLNLTCVKTKEHAVQVGNVTIINETHEVELKNLFVRVYTPLQQCFSGGVKEGDIIDVGGKEVVVVSVFSDKVTFNISGLTNIEYHKCGDVDNSKLCVEDVFPDFDLVKVSIKAIECPDIDIKKTEEQKQKKNRKVIIKPLTETYERGKDFVFRTLDNETNEPIGKVFVQFGSREGYIGSVVTEEAPSAIGRITIPEDFNSSTLYITISGGLPEGYNSSFTILNLVPWDEYKKKNTLTLVDVKVEGNEISGKVTNLNGRVIENSKVIIEFEESREEIEINEDGKFSTTINKSGKYMIKAIRTDKETSLFDSEWKELNIKLDKDGDGVIDEEDRCPEVKGVEANEGCPKEEVVIVIENPEGKFVVGEKYSGRIMHGNETLDFDGEIIIKGSKVKVKNGEFSFKPEKEGSYEIKFEGNEKYESESLRVEVVGKTNIFNLRNIGTIILIIGCIIVVYSIVGPKLKKQRVRLPRYGREKFEETKPPGAQSIR